MKRRADRDKSGFIMSLIINMIFRYEWPAAGLILVVVWVFTKVRLLLFLSVACFIIWLVLSLVVTIVLSAVSNMSDDHDMARIRAKQDQRAKEIRDIFINKK